MDTPHQQQALAPYPLLRIMGSNAFLLSILYLLVGIAVEVAHHIYPSRFVRQLSLSLDSLPARTLELVGAMAPLRAAYFDGRLSDAWVRVIFSSTTLLLIFVLALVVGVLVGSLRSFLLRRALRQSGGRGW